MRPFVEACIHTRVRGPSHRETLDNPRVHVLFRNMAPLPTNSLAVGGCNLIYARNGDSNDSYGFGLKIKCDYPS